VDTGELVLELELHAERVAAGLEQREQLVARAAAEAVAAAAQDMPLVVDRHIAPVGEVAPDLLVALAVLLAEDAERLVGEDHAEAEGVVGAVALEEHDLVAGPALLGEEREVEPARPPADHRDLHAAAPF